MATRHDGCTGPTEERFLKTTAQEAFGVGAPPTHAETKLAKSERLGSTKRPTDDRPARIGTIGEKLSDSNDPKANTFVQRSWLPSADAGLAATQRAVRVDV